MPKRWSLSPRLAAALLLTVASLSLPPGAALAASDIDPEIIDAQTGEWLVAPADGGPGCRLVFTKEETIGGFALTGADACEKTVPTIANASAWHFGGGGLVVLDPTRKVLAEFQEDESEPWHTGGADPLKLVLPPAGIDRLPTQAGLAGRWMLQTPDGKPVCAIELKAASGDDSDGRMSPAGDCPADLQALKLEFWQLDTYDLTLMAAGGETRMFTMNGSGNFETLEVSGDPQMRLVRP